MMKACIFDMDGTLINSLQDLADSANYALRAVGLPTHPTQAYRYFLGHGAGHLVESMLPEDRRTPEILSKTMEIYRRRYAGHLLDRTRPYDGIPELLRGLKKAGWLRAVVSNKPDSDVQSIVARLFGNGWFETVTGHRDGVPHKPDPQVIFNLCRQMRVQPAQCVMLGDSAVDILTARNAGLTPVGVLWGFRGRDELQKAGAEYLIEKPGDLWDVLDRLGTARPEA